MFEVKVEGLNVSFPFSLNFSTRPTAALALDSGSVYETMHLLGGAAGSVPRGIFDRAPVGRRSRAGDRAAAFGHSHTASFCRRRVPAPPTGTPAFGG